MIPYLQEVSWIQSLPPPDLRLAVMDWLALRSWMKQVPVDLQSVCTASPKPAAMLPPWTQE